MKHLKNRFFVRFVRGLRCCGSYNNNGTWCTSVRTTHFMLSIGASPLRHVVCVLTGSVKQTTCTFWTLDCVRELTKPNNRIRHLREFNISNLFVESNNLIKMFNNGSNLNKPMWNNGPQPGAFYNFPGQANSMRNSSDHGTQRSA